MRLTIAPHRGSLSPPWGAERVGVRWGMPNWVQASTSLYPSPARRVPSLSALKGREDQIRMPPLRQSQPDAEMVGDGEDVLVAAAAHVHDDQVVARQGRRDLRDMGQSM